MHMEFVLQRDGAVVELKRIFVGGGKNDDRFSFLSVEGFNGCLGTVEFSGLRPNLIDLASTNENIEIGCPGKLLSSW